MKSGKIWPLDQRLMMMLLSKYRYIMMTASQEEEGPWERGCITASQPEIRNRYCSAPRFQALSKLPIGWERG